MVLSEETEPRAPPVTPSGGFYLYLGRDVGADTALENRAVSELYGCVHRMWRDDFRVGQNAICWGGKSSPINFNL